MVGLIIALIVLLVIVLPVIWFIVSYNGLVKLRNRVQEAWHQIDVELKRRHDLIPNLVETVKGYAQHERSTLDEVLRARSAAMSGGNSPAQAAQSEGALTQALGRLIAVAEAYPDLKSNANFLALQQELASTEDRIASGRRYYNAIVRELNTKVESIPTKWVAGMAGAARAEYFEAQQGERGVPTVSFGADQGNPVGPTSQQLGGAPQQLEGGQFTEPAPYPQQQQNQPQGYPRQQG
ncbi:LemA family protein [Calidifontibacter sp. DB0510]|uniref:LemA family protein n=1 Tax=Metallococcus carri TaxID=1656884 RepID=A0A967B1L3_9MICO|nr:LemA family protein [Metallococcus carri]NHN57134.1 LemA family protein [Metallococcus carri]NOP38997.1 LemA family protein [Calidifontibacter sp. DB2511S]